jgi:diguanylate cyclase (GGDEF)-like protein/PAS domain S-box-containing protein
MIKSKLLRGILLVSLCSVIFLPLYTFVFLYPSFERLLAEGTEEEAVRLGRHLAATLLPEKRILSRDLVTPLFQHKIEMVSRDMQLVKVKVFSPEGEIIYSTELQDIGEVNRKDYFHKIVALGRTHTKIVTKATQSLEGKVMPRDVVETYVPLMSGGHFLGAFELYYDITTSRGSLNRLISHSAATVFSVALLLVAGVALSALKANRSIRARAVAEEELRRHHDQLEQLVGERTRQIERELSEKQQIEASLRHNEAKYRSLVESTEDSIYLVDRDYRYLFVNKKHLLRMGLPPDEVVGRSYGDFHTAAETESFMADASTVFGSGESVNNEHQSRRDGRYFLLTLSPVRNQDGHVAAVTVVSKDITHMKHMEEDLRSLSLTDDLTGLYNRRGFLTLADQHLKIAQRLKNKVSILYADLDGLKRINDNYGHREGDRALAEAAQVLRETFRESDIAARIGGDEFVVMPAAVGDVTIQSVSERLQTTIARVNAAAGRQYDLSISFGFAYYDPELPCSLEELLDQGDRMMYEHKKKSRGS